MSDEGKKQRRDEERFLDNLTSFLSGDNRSREDVAAELENCGIRVDDTLMRFRTALETHAPSWQDQARKAREAALSSFSRTTYPAERNRPELIADIQALLDQMQKLGAAIPAGAYHRNFQEATVEDLMSLLEDVRSQYESLQKQRGEK